MSHEQNLRKMRFLSFVQLAEDKKEIDYAVIQKEMQLEEAEIEDFIIDGNCLIWYLIQYDTIISSVL